MPFLGLAEQVDSGKPLAERQVRVMHDRTGLDAEMITASDAVPLTPAFDRTHVHIAAPGACDTTGPAQRLQVIPAGVFVSETIQ